MEADPMQGRRMSFTSDLTNFEVKFEKRSDEFIAGVEIALFSAVILATPVGNPDLWIYNRGTKENPDYVDYIAYQGYPDGYVGGRLRGNWQVTFNTPSMASTLDTDPTGSDTIAAAEAVIRSMSGGRVTYLTNNLAYAMPVEFGWSTQAPQGMVRKNAARFKRLVSEKL